jgi:replicative DNA helicase
LFTRREIAQKAFRIYEQSFDMCIDIDDLVNQMQSDTLDLLDFNASKVLTFESSVKSVIEQAKRNQKENQLIGIPTGLTKLDRHTGGFQKGDLIIIAGETSQGKTAMAVSILRNCIKNGYKAAAYSLEMTSDQLTARIISQETGIPSKKILMGKLNSFDMTCLENFPQNGLTGLFYDEQSTNTIDNICSSIRRLKLKYDISLAIVDFIQIVSGNERKNEEAKLADITRKLKNVAKEQGITVIALSQLNRDKQRPFPSIARLRGSGQIEEAADIVILLYRPEVYGLKYEDPFIDQPTEGTAQIIIGKGRNVGTGTFLVRFNALTTGSDDYVPEYHTELNEQLKF